MKTETSISELFGNIKASKIIGDNRLIVNNIAFNSRQVNKDSVFVAVKGTQVDGHQYIEQAVTQGAKAIVCERLPEKLQDDIVYIQVENSSEVLAQISHQFYGEPSKNLQLVGVTGTNGKTTIATLLYQLFKGLGYKVGLLSTVENFIHNERIQATHTTPDAVQINALLAQMVEAGCDYCFMEVSSHAIDQNRIAGLVFKGGIFTNITHDHLDYHHTFKAYIEAKKKFFDHLDKNAFALSNIDDKNGEVMLQNCRAQKRYYGVKQMCDYKSKVIEKLFDGTLIQLNQQEFWSKLIGDFNVYNLTAIIATAIELGIDKQDALQVASLLSSVNGRFESIHSKEGIIGIVDYAHTPDALENVLKTILDLKMPSQQLICVVGAGGNRDKTKRPEMAQVAYQLSNKLILTSDNPRNEKPESILDDMVAGLGANDKDFLRISDREQAIRTAVMLAQAGDIILIAGKGHETYQEIEGVKHHFDDKEILNQSFNL